MDEIGADVRFPYRPLQQLMHKLRFLHQQTKTIFFVLPRFFFLVVFLQLEIHLFEFWLLSCFLS